MRTRLSTIALAAVLSIATACSTSGGAQARSGDGLSGAMSAVSGSGPAATTFSYADLAAMRRLGIVRENASGPIVDVKWSRVVGVGFDRLGPDLQNLRSTIGLDVLGADHAVGIGTPPHTALRIDGALDSAKITSKLTALGAKRRSFGGTNGLSFGADNSIDMSGPQMTKLHLINDLDQMVVDDNRFAASPNSAALQAVLGGRSSLLDHDAHTVIANCLGPKILAATISAPSGRDNSSLLAVGVRIPDSRTGDRDEIVCSVPRPGLAGAVTRAFRSRLSANACDPHANAPLSENVSSVRIDPSGDGYVRAKLHTPSSRPAGYVFAAYFDDTVRYWDGSVTVPAGC